jgi:hypothetical protein
MPYLPENKVAAPVAWYHKECFLCAGFHQQVLIVTVNHKKLLNYLLIKCTKEKHLCMHMAYLMQAKFPPF